MCWLLHDSIEKYKEERNLFKCIRKFYDSSKGPTKELVQSYYNSCVTACKSMQDESDSKEVDISKDLKLSDIVENNKNSNEAQNKT